MILRFMYYSLKDRRQGLVTFQDCIAANTGPFIPLHQILARTLVYEDDFT